MGGQTLTTGCDEATVERLEAALTGGEAPRWMKADTSEGTMLIDLSKVDFVRVLDDAKQPRTGFSVG